MARIYIDVYTVTLTLDLLLWLKNYGLVYNGTLTFDILPWGEDNGTSLGHWRQLSDSEIYSPKKVTHNILVYRQVQIIVAVTCVLYISYVIEYKE